MIKMASALLLCVMLGCSATAPQQNSQCSAKPGSYACQVIEYEDAGGG